MITKRSAYNKTDWAKMYPNNFGVDWGYHFKGNLHFNEKITLNHSK